MWSDETDQAERDEIIADIQELIIDCRQTEKVELPYIEFDDLDAIRENIRAFKSSLLYIVEENGGLSELSKKTNIPQPSLSRLFNSDSMPHRLTLLKIAKALNLNAIPLSTPWVK
jgi:DNA-binding phage protein